MNKIKVLIVDDSPLFRRFVMDGLSKISYIDIIGYAVDPIDAMAKIDIIKPDVIACDVEMPRMDGITFVKRLMKDNPIRVVVVSALNISVFDALSAGAVDFIKKPMGHDQQDNDNFISELANKILVASQAKLRVVTGAASKAGSAGAVPGSAGSLGNISSRGRETLIALGASTGGTEALLQVVKEFPANTPGVVIVQHMPPGFTKMYAERLDKICKMEVREAKNGDKITTGLILIAPGDLQMGVVKSGSEYTVRCVPGNKVSGHRPSVDYLFSSVAKTACPNAIGAILTGMGGDGAKGLKEMRDNGAFTVGQDEATCVVYGMPMVAYNMGAVEVQAPLNKIAGIILGHLSK